ncbi:MAG: peptide-methionine (S)-S-oxide reductase MsrA [Paludibacterium sp.]|uniref:peptide-methionine (S)-S-oxide reductase MsrA n=1 Tax=Paludibacterium sp. TaxID=1917523 RepID=UPI0025D88CA9|nr:peptide-methionine (S)-S-oxide reductase MsrA [Paludibacterium sp.]MBV8046322.1 peptide-methionine (S)-S-oxide reductase MsrA [Paludibacterium sp.]MBV8649562.1 peptide-methionine (S)-S-oxide reductase MsrA [Paludibacterium sp.]
METALLAGGCFWCLEAIFSSINGVRQVESGYCGGQTANPDYEAVSHGDTGHAETVRIAFDSAVVSYATLLDVFFSIHDPTTLNRQGHDIGTQYRSAIFTMDDRQHAIATETVNALIKARRFDRPIVTEITPAGTFYSAENYHQRYYWQNRQVPYCQVVIAPKIAAFRRQHPSLFDD